VEVCTLPLTETFMNANLFNREEHEDALLHETLLCLKALSTTALALKNLNQIQSTLFPALLHMIFDEEKKGPAEFTTRNIITSLLFTYLKTAPLAERTERARTLLSYLKDPEPSESQRHRRSSRQRGVRGRTCRVRRSNLCPLHRPHFADI